MNPGTNTADPNAHDRRTRTFIYEQLISGNLMPRASEVATGVGVSVDEVRTSFRRMKEAHVLVLQDGDEEILMANPFSAVPTPFVVEIGANSWWGNCIWDAMGIAAMVKGDARVTTCCGDCNDAIMLLVQGGSLRAEQGEGIIHFSVPAKRWWDNIKFT